jgi:hypothetical protein
MSFQLDYGILGERGLVGVFRIACSLRERGVAEDGRDHVGCGVTIERPKQANIATSRSAAGSSISWRSWIRQAGRC